jgi:hypothetical protein
MRTSGLRKLSWFGAVLAFGLLTSVEFRGRAAAPFTIALPINCEVGSTCFIQNYVDHDSSEKVSDFQCGGRTYNGHDGTDIRLPDMDIQKSGVAVLAAAAGRIMNVRDGMDDVSVRVAGKGSIAGKECGNGILIEHEQGWSTQYCHMAKGSLHVKPGDRVSSGQPIGLVGLSGDTEFPHVHLTVRHNGAVVDPFAYEAPPDSCSGGHPIWTAALDAEMQYRPREIINFGFSDVPSTMELIETGEIKRHAVKADGDTLVAYVRAIGLQAGDTQAITVQGPDGDPFAEYRAPALEGNKAQFFISSGRKLKAARWPSGQYKAAYVVTKNGIEVLRKTFEVQID